MDATERLAAFYIAHYGVAAVYADDADPHARVGYCAPAPLIARPGQWLACCARAADAAMIAADAEDDRAAACGRDALIAAAARRGVALTPHGDVAARALNLARIVEDQFAAMRAGGGLRAINAEFRAARKAGRAAIYADFIKARKRAALLAIAANL